MDLEGRKGPLNKHLDELIEFYDSMEYDVVNRICLIWTLDLL